MKRHIAIKGNAERGNEIIELLEMMGGKNSEHFTGRDSDRYYFIDDNTKCICSENIYEMEECYNGVYMLFSFDAFNDDYPWRIGDIVNVIGRYDRIGFKVVKMQWGHAYNTMMYCLDCGEDGYGWWRAEDIEYTKYSELKVNLSDNVNSNIEFDLIKYSYEVKDGKLIIEKKKPKYPKTYEECCRIVNANPYIRLIYDLSNGQRYSYDADNLQLYEKIRRLLICRDAYWKIADDWSPNWNEETDKFTISNKCNDIYLNNTAWYSEVLAFPTAKMRDAFYGNFKDLIESCKELL